MRTNERACWPIWLVWAFIAVWVLVDVSQLAHAENPIVTKQTPVSAAPVHELTFDAHEKIELVANFEIPTGYESTYIWEIEGAESTVYDGGKILAVWAKPGTYRAGFEAWLINWDLRKQQHLKEKFHLVVLGARPPPDDPVVPPPDTTETMGPVTSIVLRNAEELTEDETTELSKLRDWVDEQESVQHLEFDLDAVGPDGKPNKTVATYAEAIPDTAKLPYGFISKKKKTGSGSVVLWAGEFSDADSVIKKLKEYK